jgi:CBS domain-containing protein
MTAPAMTIHTAATFMEVAQKMTAQDVARLVVIEKSSGNVLGLLSDSDLVRAVRPRKAS